LSLALLFSNSELGDPSDYFIPMQL